ncbi:hypothetical protein [Burkholderia cenocepacia]|uniref:hypothetical protein n=1 Tax=Burkholderia cenocepacia TaxID=95486 RepID=UPI001908CE4C|nr:hypothetical protein [Burkholderia cenocepacia]MBJ9897859.1 hypothetical protein [Burkholderia cenocepacia]MBR8119347.1 hypothetical protein [Burkholderia cenocepacia]MBR8374052.1 hypothetical protein [Burkholderia cenocepacia]MBR8443027.1 hypothetical protein [Burkholderia cenocepacia]
MSEEKAGAPPVVFHFQPKGYRVLTTPDELKEWERMMRENVGLTADISNISGSLTQSMCNQPDYDDCDND